MLIAGSTWPKCN